MRQLVVAPLLIVFAISVGYSRASAQCDATCVTILDTGCFSCNGQPECIECPTYCHQPGCSCGTCISQGGSGDCCGHTYYSAEIYGDGSGNCSGDLCGEAPTHALTHITRGFRKNPHEAEVAGGYSPGLIMITATASYKPESMLYVYSNCSHDLKLIMR